MMRLAVSGIDEASLHEVGKRVRHATVVSYETTAAVPGSKEVCNAVAWFGPSSPDVKVIEQHLLAGRHVLLATGTHPLFSDWGRLSDCASRAGVQWSVVNPDHALPSRQIIRQQLENGTLGRVGLIRSHRWETGGAESASPADRLPGPLLGELETVLWLAGATPNVVYAIEQTEAETTSTSDSLVQVHLGFADGGMALVTHSNRLPPGDTYRSLTVIGSSGAAYADDQQDRQLLFAGGRAKAVRTGAESVCVAVLQEFADAVCAGRDLSSGRSRWTQVGRVAEAVRQSLLSGQAVRGEAD